MRGPCGRTRTAATGAAATSHRCRAPPRRRPTSPTVRHVRVAPYFGIESRRTAIPGHDRSIAHGRGERRRGVRPGSSGRRRPEIDARSTCVPRTTPVVPVVRVYVAGCHNTAAGPPSGPSDFGRRGSTAGRGRRRPAVHRRDCSPGAVPAALGHILGLGRGAKIGLGRRPFVRGPVCNAGGPRGRPATSTTGLGATIARSVCGGGGLRLSCGDRFASRCGAAMAFTRRRQGPPGRWVA